MRRHGGLWERVSSFDNLCRAAHRAALGKRTVAGVARFLERLEPEVLALQRDLDDGSYRPGHPFTFVIRDPKERTITAVPFRDSPDDPDTASGPAASRAGAERSPRRFPRSPG